MGRRATDLTTPVPVLGVPALVGVRAWKTTGGDRGGGTLLKTWGLQCSVGVQTSPRISKPPTELPDTLSENITQTSDGYNTKEATEIPPLTRSDNEKKTILKQKTGEAKIKKEVTFKGCGGDASKDVACCRKRSGGTYCYARAIRSNSLITSGRPKLKSGPRYTNGSVVDSEAIGGISVVNDEQEPVKGAVSHGRDPQNHYADQTEKMPPLIGARPFAVSGKICSNCGGRQPVTSRAAIRSRNSSSPYSYLTEKPLNQPFTPLLTNNHSQAPHIEKNSLNSTLNPDKSPQTIVEPQTQHVNELKDVKTPYPACPVHARGHLANLSDEQAVRDGASIQPATVLHSKTITVTKATIESRQDVKSLAKFPQYSDKNFPASLNWTPEIAKKSDMSRSNCNPLLCETAHYNSAQDPGPKNVSVSVHASPDNAISPPSYMYTVAKGTGNTSTTGTDKSNTTFPLEVGSTNSNDAKADAQEKNLNSIQKVQRSEAKGKFNFPRMDAKLPASSLPANIFDHTEKSEPNVSLTPESSSCYAFKPQKEPQSGPIGPSADRVLNSVVNSPMVSSPHSLVSTFNHKAHLTEFMSVSTQFSSVASKIDLIQTSTSNSESALRVSASSVHTSATFKSLDSKEKLPKSEALSSTSKQGNGTSYKNITCRTITFDLRKPTTPSYSPLSSQREKQNNLLASSATLPQSKKLSGDEASDTSKHRLSQTTDIKTHEGNEPNVWGVIPNQENNSKTTPPVSEKRNVSENHDRGGDANSHHPKQTINRNEDLYSDLNEVRGNLISQLVAHESKHQANGDLSQVTCPQNCIYLIKSSSSCLQGCLSTEQQKLAHYQRRTGTERHSAGQSTPKPSQHADPSMQQFESVSDASANLKSTSNGQAHPIYAPSSLTSQTNWKTFNSRKDELVKPAVQSPACQNSVFFTTLLTQAHSSGERRVTAPASLRSEGELRASMGTRHNSTMPSSTLRLASGPCLQSSSKFNPAPSQSSPEENSLVLSRPADTDVSLQPSTECCKSTLQQRLEAVEASLEANKDRITTLLNIIHDLETSHTPTGRRQCCKTGQDLKSCSTCQKTACIVYSVEYDFRQQEKGFLDVLNRSPDHDNTLSAHLDRPLNFNLLRNAIIKNLRKTKLKSKKFGKTLLKWLPRKIQKA
ncbi:unnamed protein product [Menidia menidia]|uniref:(Atlantic silverside) hypothetical protein n=1 Tax=Menidia menidia TaxID=238744 RepID=A0A8S4AQH3_9TELE|nr:unnamed protein product [Menidia menidia]